MQQSNFDKTEAEQILKKVLKTCFLNLFLSMSTGFLHRHNHLPQFLSLNMRFPYLCYIYTQCQMMFCFFHTLLHWLLQMNSVLLFRKIYKIHNKFFSGCLTNLEELSFLTVLALPKASRMGFACSSCFSNSP